MYYVTFKQLRDAKPCRDRYQRLAKKLGGVKRYGQETPISLIQILDSNGLEDCLWSFRAVAPTPEFERFSRLLACDFAEHVLPIYEAKYPGDSRPRNAIETSRRYANGEAVAVELAGAREAAWEAARVAGDATTREAAWNAALAAWNAATREAANAAAWDA